MLFFTGLSAQWIPIGNPIQGQQDKELFSYSVSMSAGGKRLAVGARDNNESGTRAGEVRVFDENNGIWTQVGADLTSNLTQSVFGNSLGLSADGKRLVVGAHGYETDLRRTGLVRVFEEINGNWIQLGNDIIGEEWTALGRQVAISADGQRIVAAANRDNGKGVIRIFEENNGFWIQVGSDIEGQDDNDAFGVSLSISSDGRRVVGGSPYHDAIGQARVFEEVGGVWTQVGGDIDGDYGQAGNDVKLSGDGQRVAVGAVFHDGNGYGSGQIRIFEEVGGNWVQVGTDIYGETVSSQAGGAIDLSEDGTIIAIGGRKSGDGSENGYAAVYRETGGTWVQVGSTQKGEAPATGFGFAVDLTPDGKRLATGTLHNQGPGSGPGEAQVFEYTTTCLDVDGDGYFNPLCGGLDCNDSSPTAYPGATEVCDGIDNNCDGLTDNEDPDVVDNLPPVAVCKDATLTFNGEGELFLQTEDVWDELSSTDNCGDVYFVEMAPFDMPCDNVGDIIPVTVTIEDGQGNIGQCIANVAVGGLPCGWSYDGNGVNCPGSTLADYDAAAEAFFVSSTGCYDPNHYRPTDAHGYVGTELCGDGEIIAKVDNVMGTGWAGISMRDGTESSEKMIQLMLDGVYLSRRELRQSTGGTAFAHLMPTMGRNWLRLIRSGNIFGAYHSVDGVNWEVVLQTTINMDNCIDVGLITMNGNPSTPVTAIFTNVTTSFLDPLSAPEQPDMSNSMNLEKNKNSGGVVFPNPSKGQFEIQLNQPVHDRGQVRIVNHLGVVLQERTVEPQQQSSVQIDMTAYESGFYYLQIDWEKGETEILKLIKQD